MIAKYAVILTPDAEADLAEIYDYISENDAPAKADFVLGKLEEQVLGLEVMPERGALTKELLKFGIRDYRETYFKPYRIIYRVEGRQVEVYLIVDGRRDMQTLLQQRILRG